MIALDDANTGEGVDVIRSFEAFYNDHYRNVLALAYGATGKWGDAEDLTQEAFAACYRRWNHVSGYDDPLAWVKRCVMNRSVSRWRKLTSELKTMTRLGSRAAAATEPPLSADDELWAAVRNLPAPQRRVVVMHYVDDLSVDEIGRVLGIAVGTVKSQLSRARSALASQLGEMRRADGDE